MPQSENFFTIIIYNVIFCVDVPAHFTVFSSKMPNCASYVFQNRQKVFKKKINHAKRKIGDCKNFTHRTPLPLQLPSIPPGRPQVRRTQGKWISTTFPAWHRQGRPRHHNPGLWIWQRKYEKQANKNMRKIKFFLLTKLRSFAHK